MTKSSFEILAIATALGVFVASGTGVNGSAAGAADDYLQSARRLERANDLKGAEIQLRNAAQAEPGNGIILLELAQVYLRLGDGNAAQAELFAAHSRGVKEELIAPWMAQALLDTGEFGNLLRDVPAGNRSPRTESAVRTARGIAELALAEYGNAQASLSDAERLDPKAASPKIAMAKLDLAQNKLNDAGNKIDEALSLEPRNSQALEEKGLVLLMSGKVDAAVQQFTAAIAANPRDIQPLLDRANVELNRGNLNQADKDIQTAQSIAPGSVVAMFLRAGSDAKHGDLKAADAMLGRLSGLMDRIPDAYLLAAEVKLKLNQAAQAEDDLNKFVAKRSDQPRAYQLLGILAFQRGDLDRAIAMLERALQLAPRDTTTTGLLGRAYVSRGELGKARALFERAVQLQPNSTSLQAARAATEFDSGDTENSLAQLVRLFNGGAGNLQAGPPVVLAALKTGHLDEADAAANALVKHDSGSVLYQELLAMVRVAEHDYPAAENLYKTVLSREPGTFAARRDLAQLYLATNRSSDAKKLFQDRVSTNTSDVNSAFALADIDVQTKDYDGALKLLAREQQALPADPSPSLRMIAIEELQKKWPDALTIAHNLQARFANNPAVVDAAAQATFAAGDHTSGVAAYQRAATAFPTSAIIMAHYAGALAAQGDYAKARDAISKAVALDPNSATLKGSLIYLTFLVKGGDAAVSQAESFATAKNTEPGGVLVTAQVLEGQGKRADAITLIEKWQAREPSGELVAALAHLYLRANQPTKATSVLELWTSGHPGDIKTQNVLAETYGALGRPDLALAQYERLAAQQPNDPIILNNLAWFLDSKHDPRALGVAQKAAQLAPTSGSIADTLGWILMNSGNGQAALKYLEFAGAQLPTDPTVQYHYGFALYKDGKVDAARTVLRKLLDLKPNSETLSAANTVLAALNSGRQEPPRAH